MSVAPAIAQVIAALAVPPDALIEQRVPKKILLEQGAPTPGDKRQIQDGVEELFWIAALKPTNIGVPEYRDSTREYLEIAILTLTLRQKAKAPRLIELVHRAIPYPVVLMTTQDNGVNLSLAHKRFSQGEAGKSVIEDLRSTTLLQQSDPTPQEIAFLTNAAIANLRLENLFTLYQGWIDRVVTLDAARITGVFQPPDSVEKATALRTNLDAHDKIKRDIAMLRSQVDNEKQVARRVELNLEIRKLETELAETTSNL
jgi:hypothetical protein